MRVETKDGSCRECGGALEIIDADDATMTVECEDGGHCYAVEHDAFGDGCMIYLVEFLASRQEGGDDDDA